MTEQDYIDATDLAKVRAAREILRHVRPELSKVIKGAEYVRVFRLLEQWEDRLVKGIGDLEHPEED